MLHLHCVGHPICDPSRIIATRSSYCSFNPLHPQKFIHLQLHLSWLHKLSGNLLSHHKRIDFFSASATSNNPPFFLVVTRWLCNGPRYLRNDFCIPRAPQNILHKNIHYILLYPPLQRSWKGGILVSPCPSVCLWTESCPLCIFNNTHRIHFIFAHLIKQAQKVFCM